MNENEIDCPYCFGAGYWECECCSGASGCSCEGQPVNMGDCQVCHGTGRVIDGEYDISANGKVIEGYCFLGSGPKGGYWANAPALGRKHPPPSAIDYCDS